jgi:O-antigen/teichoic acid export membrane protein
VAWPLLKSRPSRLPIDPITRGWAVVTSAGLVRLGFGFVASLAIARSLGVADFGTYSVLAATVGIVGSLAEGGLSEAAVLRMSEVRRSLREAGARARTFFWLRLGLAAAVAALGCALAFVFGGQFLNIDPVLIGWALLGIVATAASGAVGAMLQAIGSFGRMSSLTLVNTVATAALAVALALLGRLDLLSALIVLGIGTSVLTFAAGRSMLPRSWSLALPSIRRLTAEADPLFATGRWLWLASIFAMVTANAEVLLLNQWMALPVVGAYALASNLASKADVVNHSLYTVLLPGLSSLRGRGALTDYLRRGLLRGGTIALGLVLLIPLVQPFVLLFYGQQFAAAVPFLQLLLGVMAFDVVLTPLLLLPLAYRRPRVLAAADGARAITLVAVALILLPVVGALGAIVARFAARVAGAILVLVALWSDRAALEIEHEEAASVA